MAAFAEKMKSLTDNILASTHQRLSALVEIGEHTERILADARSFMSELDKEHQTRATEIRSTLAAQRAECTEHAKEFRQRCVEQMNEMRTKLHEMLAANQSARQDSVGQMFHGFQEAREQLTGDLREAGQVWRNRKSVESEHLHARAAGRTHGSRRRRAHSHE